MNRAVNMRGLPTPSNNMNGATMRHRAQNTLEAHLKAVAVKDKDIDIGISASRPRKACKRVVFDGVLFDSDHPGGDRWRAIDE